MQELATTKETDLYQEEEVGNERLDNETSSSPNWFFMFKSVLKIFKETYDERCQSAERNGSEGQLETRKGSMCPVLNGSITDSEFWDALQSNGMMDSDLFGGDMSGLEFDSAMEGWEWMNDSNL